MKATNRILEGADVRQVLESIEYRCTKCGEVRSFRPGKDWKEGSPRDGCECGGSYERITPFDDSPEADAARATAARAFLAGVLGQAAADRKRTSGELSERRSPGRP